MLRKYVSEGGVVPASNIHDHYILWLDDLLVECHLQPGHPLTVVIIGVRRRHKQADIRNKDLQKAYSMSTTCGVIDLPVSYKKLRFRETCRRVTPCN
jgi:hypothetical protein